LKGENKIEILIAYKGYGGVTYRAKGTPEELGLELAKVARSKASGRMRDGRIRVYSNDFAEILRKETNVPETREIVLEAFAEPFDVGIRAGHSPRITIPLTVIDVIDMEK